MNLYEAMFVVNSNAAKEDYDKVDAEVQSCITRFGGEIVNSIKWDERRLAYEIKNQKRGAYILVHFNAPGDSISKIERQVKLSEVILRALIIRDEDGEEAKPFDPSRGNEFDAEVEKSQDRRNNSRAKTEEVAEIE